MVPRGRSGTPQTKARSPRRSGPVRPLSAHWRPSEPAARPAGIGASGRGADSSPTAAAAPRGGRPPASWAATTNVSLRACVKSMSNPLADDDQPLDPEAARMVAKVRWLMLISGVTTLIAIAAVIGVIGYRVFKGEGSAPADVTALLPKGSRIIATAVAEGRIT